MAEIKLTRGYVAIVDDEDYERINSYNWFANVTTFPNGRVRVRAARMRNRQMIYMHHEVLGILPSSLDGDHVDHEDGDSLNNRKKNLTVKTPMQNSHNTKRHKERKGYCFNKRGHRWYCYIDEPGKPRKNIGYAATESEAKAKVEAYRDAHR